MHAPKARRSLRAHPVVSIELSPSNAVKQLDLVGVNGFEPSNLSVPNRALYQAELHPEVCAHDTRWPARLATCASKKSRAIGLGITQRLCCHTAARMKAGETLLA